MRVLSVMLLVACSSKAAKEHEAICEKAAERYASCVGELLGPELEAAARSKDGTAACARDNKTVAMYRTCLPSATCADFMDCMERYAQGSRPTIANDKPRAEQCAQHVEEGLRGIANTTMMMNELRRDDEKQRAQECLLDESRPWQECTTDAERAEVMAYAEQRQRDCEAWDDALAACVLRQPGAKNCNEDEFPLWEAPVEAGPAGPSIAWTATLTDADSDESEARARWAGNRTLIVCDDRGLHAFAGGKGRAAVERWSLGLANVDCDLVVAGNHIVLRDKGESRGLVVWDATTGKQLGRALPGVAIEHHDAVGDRVIVQTADNELYEITAQRCSSKKQQGKGCARKLGTLDEDDALYTTHLATWRDAIVMTSMSGLHVVDRRAKTRLALHYDDADTIVPAGDRVVVVRGGRVRILALEGCTADADCEVARHAIHWVSSIDPMALPGGAVAFNDHGIVENTHLVDGTSAWKVKTNGRGGVAGDAKHVYTVSFGRSRKQPTHLLALARATGKVVWQTALPGAAHDAVEAEVQVRHGLAAVRVGDKLYVLELH